MYKPSTVKQYYCHRPLSRNLYTCPLKAGHAGTASLISHVLPNFIMLLDALRNTYLGSCKSKDGDKAEPIPEMFIDVINIYKFILFLEVP